MPFESTAPRLATDSHQMFFLLLSNVREGTERAMAVFQDMSRLAHNHRLKDALDAWVFVSGKTLAKLDRCFSLFGHRQAKGHSRLPGLLVEEFRKDLASITSADARHLFILIKASQLIHLRLGEYIVLIAASEVMGRKGITVLLESCLGDTNAFIEQLRGLVTEAMIIAEASHEKI